MNTNFTGPAGAAMICLGLIARTVPRFEAVMWEASCGPSSPRSRSSRNSAAGAASAPDALPAGALAEVAFDVPGHEGGFVFSKCHRECSSSELESLLIASRSKCSLSASETWAASVEYGARRLIGIVEPRVHDEKKGRRGLPIFEGPVRGARREEQISMRVRLSEWRSRIDS